jgi:predicted ABC-type ATPase
MSINRRRRSRKQTSRKRFSRKRLTRRYRSFTRSGVRQPATPVVIITAGPTGSGKTILKKEMVEKLKVPDITSAGIDDLVEAWPSYKTADEAERATLYWLLRQGNWFLKSNARIDRTQASYWTASDNDLVNATWNQHKGTGNITLSLDEGGAVRVRGASPQELNGVYSLMNKGLYKKKNDEAVIQYEQSLNSVNDNNIINAITNKKDVHIESTGGNIKGLVRWLSTIIENKFTGHEIHIAYALVNWNINLQRLEARNANQDRKVPTDDFQRNVYDIQQNLVKLLETCQSQGCKVSKVHLYDNSGKRMMLLEEIDTANRNVKSTTFDEIDRVIDILYA